MTVGDLINILSHYDSDTVVYLQRVDDEGYYDGVYEVTDVDLEDPKRLIIS
ncbi:MAG: hypothetical protein IJA20_02780 [Methanocorpusculum sp.]|nr:hypothetical protein [Methanocorpusculum sp.]